MEHKWEEEEVDGGPLGVGHFWKCSVCGASGGPVWPDKEGVRQKLSNWQFLGNGSGLQLTSDCEESQRLIDAFNLGVEYAPILKKRKK